MRITNIEVTNFQGLRHAALAVSEPVLLVSGFNGAGKSSLLDAISMALTGQPRRVSLKKDMAKLVTEGAKKGEAVVSWNDATGEQESAAVVLPSGKGAPLVDLPCLPFVLDASKFGALDEKERRRTLFSLTGASASPNEIAKRLVDKGAEASLIERIKPMLRTGFDAAVVQAKEYASEARGAWKAITGEAYGSEKAEGWEPETVAVEVKQEDLEAVTRELSVVELDLSEAQQTIGGHKAAMAAADQRQQRIAELRETAALLQRRQHKLGNDSADLTHWQGQLAAAEAAAACGKQGLVHDMARNLADWQALAQRTAGVRATDSGLTTPWAVLEEMDRAKLLFQRYTAEHGPLADAGADDAQLAKRIPEFQTYVDNLSRTVANDQRDVKASQDAVVQLEALEAEAANIPLADAMANAEQAIHDLRQQRDRLMAKQQALQDAHRAQADRGKIIAEAAGHHAAVTRWTLIADALAPTGIPAEILAGALAPVNALLAELSSAASWLPVQISNDIGVEFGGRPYGLLSESERWRCDALLAIAIASLSGLRFVVLDRYDVLDLPSRGQIIRLLMARTQDGTLDSAIIAGTMKAPMAATPPGLQAVWVEGGVIGTAMEAAA